MTERLRSLLALAVLTTVLCAMTLALPGSASATRKQTTTTFNPNLMLAGSSDAAEPSIRTDRLGQSFVIAPIGVPAGCKAFRVSHDGSHSSFLGFPDQGAGGGDCDWAIGPQEAATLPGFGPSSDNDLAYSSLSAADITVGKSNDGGTTFGPPNPGASQVAGDDRMWMTGDPQLNSLGLDDVYMIYHDLSVGDIQLSVSRDGGQTYVQNGPIINNTDVPQGQWEVVGLSPGNFIGNIVARRSSGALTLYSIFETADSGADNVQQGVAGTANYNRVYEAVGTVTDVPAPGAPVISWRNYEIYHGPAGANYGRLFPITAVDSAGKVYAFWSDGNHILSKTDATGTGWNPAAAPSQIPNPTGVNTAIMPWAQGGTSGVVDLVFYGAHGGAGTQPNPQDDPNNVWDVYMAQTVSGGTSWTVFKASDHDIHTGDICIHGLNCDLFGGDRTLLDFFQVSIDPTNGAADIAYADDHATPGTPTLYFTRQCTGTSATTGLALVNDCVAPPPPASLPQGTTCPGPQVLDFVGDAPNNFLGGDGSNIDGVDIVSVSFGTPDASHITVTLTIKNLSVPPPPLDINGAYWSAYWTYNNVNYIAQASGTGDPATIQYTVGVDDGNQADATLNPAITGSFNPGANGTIVFTVPLSMVGGPPSGSSLTNTYADTHVSVVPPAALGGVYYTAPADRAPDANYGADYVVNKTCHKTRQ
jgi:hypothetical protein